MSVSLALNTFNAKNVTPLKGNEYRRAITKLVEEPFYAKHHSLVPAASFSVDALTIFHSAEGVTLKVHLSENPFAKHLNVTTDTNGAATYIHMEKPDSVALIKDDKEKRVCVIYNKKLPFFLRKFARFCRKEIYSMSLECFKLMSQPHHPMNPAGFIKHEGNTPQVK